MGFFNNLIGNRLIIGSIQEQLLQNVMAKYISFL